jgi:octaprenyl-diphosphate synthase
LKLTKALDLNEIYAPIAADLEAFSAILKKELESQDALIGDIHRHLLKMTGKFLRPALVIFSSKIENKDNPKALTLAVAIELIHTATLVHDDIIDNSLLRRNQPSVYSKWGREISIVSGDYLYAKAFMALASLQDVWINEAFAACARVICEGEMKQIEKRSDFLMSHPQYLKIIHQKTAALFQASCMGGAYLAGMDHKNIQSLGDYGFGLGMAFQIVDDCLDIAGETKSLGKTAGLDIYKNDVTLPLLYLFEALLPAERQNLLGQIQAQDPGVFDKIKSLCSQTQAIDKSMNQAKTYIDQAIQALKNLPESPSKEALEQLAVHCLDRAR